MAAPLQRRIEPFRRPGPATTTAICYSPVALTRAPSPPRPATSPAAERYRADATTFTITTSPKLGPRRYPRHQPPRRPLNSALVVGPPLVAPSSTAIGAKLASLARVLVPMANNRVSRRAEAWASSEQLPQPQNNVFKIYAGKHELQASTGASPSASGGPTRPRAAPHLTRPRPSGRPPSSLVGCWELSCRVLEKEDRGEGRLTCGPMQIGAEERSSLLASKLFSDLLNGSVGSQIINRRRDFRSTAGDALMEYLMQVLTIGTGIWIN